MSKSIPVSSGTPPLQFRAALAFYLAQLVIAALLGCIGRVFFLLLSVLLPYIVSWLVLVACASQQHQGHRRPSHRVSKHVDHVMVGPASNAVQSIVPSEAARYELLSICELSGDQLQELCDIDGLV